jgi:hypothetical protein
MTTTIPTTVNLANVEFCSSEEQNESGDYRVGLLEETPVYLVLPSPLMTLSQSAVFKSNAFSSDDKGKVEVALSEKNAEKIIEILNRSELQINNVCYPLKGFGSEDYTVERNQAEILIMTANIIILLRNSERKKKTVDNGEPATVDQESQLGC